MKTNSFINKQTCTRIATKLREWANLGGCDAYDVFLSKDVCINAAEQFEIWRDKNGGEYFCNIISKPHFSNAEIETILNII